MLELGVFMNGQTDLPVRQTPTGTVLPSGSLADMHASYQRGVLNQIKQGVLAEKLGFDYLWPVEHHFQPEGAEFSPNPMLMEMAVAAQTSRIRLGQYANILTWWHPLRIAEQAAMLDVVSGGRLDVGIGRGGTLQDYQTFQSDRADAVCDLQANQITLRVLLCGVGGASVFGARAWRTCMRLQQRHRPLDCRPWRTRPPMPSWTCSARAGYA